MLVPMFHQKKTWKKIPHSVLEENKKTTRQIHPQMNRTNKSISTMNIKLVLNKLTENIIKLCELTNDRHNWHSIVKLIVLQ